MKGIEPLTYALRERRSTPELHRRTLTLGYYRIFRHLVKFIGPLLIMLSCTAQAPTNPRPGVFEVSIYDEHDVFTLDGQWLFEWEADGIVRPIKVPGYWNNLLGLSPYGRAVYRARVNLPKRDMLLGLDIGEIQTAYRLYVDDQEVGGMGNPRDSGESGVALGHRRLFFRARGPVDIKIVVANHFNPIGGIGDSLFIGLAGSVHRPRFLIKLFYIVISGILVFLLVYFLIFSVWGYRKPTFLSLSGLIFFSLIRDNLLNQRLISLYFPHLNSVLLTKLEYVTILGVAVCFVAYLWQFFQDQRYRAPFFILSAFSVLYLLLLIFVPFHIFVTLFKGYIILALMVLVFMLIRVFMKRILPKRHRMLFFLSLIPLFLGAVHDLVQGFFMLGNIYFFNTGMTVYLLLQAVILHQIQRESIASTMKLQEKNRHLQQSRSALLVAFLPKFRSRLVEILRLSENLSPDFRKGLMDFGISRLEFVFHVFNKCFQNNLEIDWNEVERLVKTLPEPTNLQEPFVSDKKHSVLIVDDEVINRFLVTSLLKQEGILVLEADSGHRAIECLDVSRPDLILMDIMMSPLNGYQTILELKKRHGTLPPFCFLTAKSDHEDIVHSLRLGACGFQTKPFSVKSFFPKLQDYLLLHHCPSPLSPEAPVELRLQIKNFQPTFSLEEKERIESCLLGSFPHFEFSPDNSTLTVNLPPTPLIHQVLRFLLILEGVNVPMTARDAQLPHYERTSPGLILSRKSLGYQIPNLAASVYLEELEKDVFFFSWHSALSTD